MDTPVNQSLPWEVDSSRLAWRRHLRLALQGLEQALLPPTCLVCDEAGDHGRDLCADCAAALPWNRRPCSFCALPLDGPETTCVACQRQRPPFAAVLAPLVYADPLDRLLPALKFHGDLAVGRLLGQVFADAFRHRARRTWPQALLPVPLHPRRLRERGYNQAQELARQIAADSGIPLAVDLLRRARSTEAQSALHGSARLRNVRGAFALSGGPSPAHVALVDDVMTTGATLAECARLLHAAGVETIEAWVIARVPKHHAGV